MLAESEPRWLTWIDGRGRSCHAECDICFPETRPEDIPYSSISTWFDRYQPGFDLSRATQKQLDAAEGKSGDGIGDERQGNGGNEPPSGDDQRDREDGGAGAKLTLFVDVAAEEAEKFRP